MRDVCDLLGIVNVTRAVDGLLPTERGIHTVNTPGGPQKMTCVDESGLYKLIFKGRKPEAEAFRMWVFEEVLPSIRQTGQYAVPGLAATHPDQ